MKEDNEKKEVQSPETPVDERPNRSAYAKMFNEDYPDVDFEDKEARYGKMVEDRQRYKELSNAGRSLSTALDKNRWLGAMFQDLAENPDKDPVTWMYENGIDVTKAMEDEEYRQQVSEKLGEYQARQAEGEQAAAERDKNLQTSLDNLLGMGLDESEAEALWNHFFTEVLDPALRGEVSTETWQAIRNARNYDNDIASAREEGASKARNEKLTNKLKKFDTTQNVPPTFSQGAGQSGAKPKKKGGFFDDLQNYH